MDKAINDFIDSLIVECLSSPYFSALSKDERSNFGEKIKNHFNNVSFDLLVDNLTEEQLNQVKDLDFKDPEMAKKLQLFAAGIPGFAFTMEQKLKDEATRISQTGHIPA